MVERLVRALALTVAVAVAALALALALAGGVGNAPAAQDSGAVASDDRGIGGTGIEGDDRGIGGTGVYGATEGEDRGIGGTGIFGTITGFGSVIVNGLEIEIDQALPVASIAGASPAGQLAVGQVVAIEADERAGRLFARRAELYYPVSGAIEAIDRANRRAQILGQWIEIGDATSYARADGSTGRLADLRVGDRVSVSGLRRADGVIQASRITARGADFPDSVSGPVTASGPGRLRIGGLEVDWSDDVAASAPAIGREITVVGRLRGARLNATRLATRPEIAFGGRLSRLSIEGFPRAARGGGGFVLGGMPIPRGEIDAGAPARLRKMVVEGGLDRARRARAERLWRPGLDRAIGTAPRRNLHAPPPGGLRYQDLRRQAPRLDNRDLRRAPQTPRQRNDLRRSPSRSRQARPPARPRRDARPPRRRN